jgi:nucleoside-diphosphate-sugar epimerase
MKVFVTGGTGFIGSHFLNQAHDAGHEIIALRRSSNSKPRIRLKQEPTWLDKAQEEVGADDLTGCETLIHLAAHSANAPYDTLEACIEHNVLAPLKLFRTASRAGISRFIVAGSCFEYGRSGERYEFIPPDAPLEPTASYPASKAAASIAFHALGCELKLKLLILRIFQVYGEGEADTRFWPTLCRAAATGVDLPMSLGAQVRDFIHVSEVASKFVDAIARKDLITGHPTVENLGCGNPMSLAAFATSEWKRLNAKGELKLGAVPMRPEEIMRYVPQL